MLYPKKEISKGYYFAKRHTDKSSNLFKITQLINFRANT